MDSLLVKTGIYNAGIVDRLETDTCCLYRVANETGEGVITSYPVFDGVEVIYNDFHMEYWRDTEQPLNGVLEINHCREGRFECEFPNGACVYLDEGDLALNKLGNPPRHSSFPLRHYHGITIAIDLPTATRSTQGLLDTIAIDISAISDRLCPSDQCFIMRETDSIHHIFSELYTAPPEIRLGYMKIKTLELLLFLSLVKPAENKTQHLYHRKSQVEKVKAIKAFLVGHLDENHTLASLAGQFDVPLATLKRCFKGVYGTSPHAFLKTYRMQYAAHLLKNEHCSVTELAGKVGYGNVSKFSAAFKAAYGVSPSLYQKTNQMEQP